jgi:hypothetical protein
MLEKEIHNFSHCEVILCTHTDKHFHQEEHHCNLCDFTRDVADRPIFFQHDLLIERLCDLNFIYTIDQIEIQKAVYSPLRAPPIS